MGLLFKDHYRQEWKDALLNLVLFVPGEDNAQTVHPYEEQSAMDPHLLPSDLSRVVFEFTSALDIMTDEPQQSYFEACAEIRGNFRVNKRASICLKTVKENVLREMMDFCCSILVDVCIENGGVAVFENRKHETVILLFQDRLILAQVSWHVDTHHFYTHHFSFHIKLTGHSAAQCRAYPTVVESNSFWGTWKVRAKNILSRTDRERALAFAMSQHGRLGSDSLARQIPEDLLVSMIFRRLVPNEVTGMEMKDYIVEIFDIELDEWWKEVRSQFHAE
jgi:hypothetical protein